MRSVALILLMGNLPAGASRITVTWYGGGTGPGWNSQLGRWYVGATCAGITESAPASLDCNSSDLIESTPEETVSRAGSYGVVTGLTLAPLTITSLQSIASASAAILTIADSAKSSQANWAALSLREGVADGPVFGANTNSGALSAVGNSAAPGSMINAGATVTGGWLIDAIPANAVMAGTIDGGVSAITLNNASLTAGTFIEASTLSRAKH